VVAIANPIVTPELLEKARAPVAHPWLEPGSPPVVLGAGRLTRQKRFDVLLHAFALVTRTRPARLLLLGEGEDRVELEALASSLGLSADQYSFPGYVENPYAYMSRASLFVLSSDFEGLPSVLIEALATGCPVVSTDCPGGASEILRGGAVAPLVPVDDPPALAAAMLRLLEEPPDREPLRQRGLDYGMATAVDRYLEVLLAAGRSQSSQQVGGPFR
jgi:glycosyltransferase involved in cell wall biosynthesis